MRSGQSRQCTFRTRAIERQRAGEIARAVPGVRKFRCEQFSLDRFRVQLVTGTGWQAAARDGIRRGLEARLGATVAVEIQEVPAIPPLPSGKERQVISHLTAATAAEH